MPLVKCNDGMIEGENFYLASSIDFLGNNMECYVMDNYFVLSKGSIERSLSHNTFVIEVKKKYNTTSSKDAAFFYKRFIGKEEIYIFNNLKEKEIMINGISLEKNNKIIGNYNDILCKENNLTLRPYETIVYKKS